MQSKEWYDRAVKAIVDNDLKEAHTLSNEVPFKFRVPPVSVANWDDLSWVKWLILFVPKDQSIPAE